MEKDNHFDCVVVGSGQYGLAAAKHYHVLHPDESLVIYEASPSLGGTWSQERLYPNLKTNTLSGLYDFPDYPMDPKVTNLRRAKDPIPGETVNAYFKTYAQHFGIDELIQFNTKVTVAEHQTTSEGGWILTLEVGKEDQVNKSTYTVSARRLIVATGLTSQPIKPEFKGQESYQGPIFHLRNFPDNLSTLQTAKNATVYGTGKSSLDVAYNYALAGAQVDWVVRSTGHGLGWVVPAFVTPFSLCFEKLVNRRLVTWFSPSIWADSDGFGGVLGFLQRNRLGRLLTCAFWTVLTADLIRLIGFNKHPDTKKLKAQFPIMFAGVSTSILNYDHDVFQLVRDGRIKLHYSEIDRLSAGKVHLADGTSLDSDVMMAFGGWQQSPPIKFLPEGIEDELGLLHAETEGEWGSRSTELAKLVEHADAEILRRLPLLRNRPQFPNYVPRTGRSNDKKEAEGGGAKEPPPLQFLMHRFLAPQSARLLRCHDIAFAGLQASTNAAITAHVGGLWISAYLDGRLASDPSAAAADEEAFAKLRYEDVLHNRFGHWRYPIEWDRKAPCFVFDHLTYISMLLRDLGLQTHRKGSLWREVIGSYGIEEFSDICEEWKALQASERKKTKV